MLVRRSIFDRPQNLIELSGERFSARGASQPRHLHRHGRTARNDMAMACPLQRGAPKAQNINARMRVKTMVLISNEHREETRIDIVRRDGKPPAPIRRREGPQKAAVAIDGDRRALARAREIERSMTRVPE